MKKSYIALLPTALLAISTATGCSSEDALTKYVKGLKVGEVTQEQVDHIFTENLYDINDSKITHSTYTMKDYTPYWLVGPGQPEEDYESIVRNLQQTIEYKRYNNNVVVCNETFKNYPYDKNQVKDDDSEGFSTTKVEYKAKEYIYLDEEKGTANYIYTRNNSATDPYSFAFSRETAEGIMDKYNEGPKTSSNLLSMISDVNQLYEGYSSAKGVNPVSEYKAVKSEDGKLKVSFDGRLKFDLYSAERYWGWKYAETDTEYANPLTKETSDYDGLYVDMGINVRYSFTIDQGIVASAEAVYFGYYRYLLKDRNYKTGDPVPEVKLSADYIAGLDLYLPETITDNGSEIPNPFTGQILSQLPHTYEKFENETRNFSNYSLSNLPDTTEYREADETDVGAWFSVQDMRSYVEE